MRLSLLALTLSSLAASCGEKPASSEPPHDFHAKVVLEDFRMVEGDGWTGSLTYLNYGEPEEAFSIPVELDLGREGRTLKLDLSYPDETQANRVSEIEISDEGRLIGGAKVIRREEHENSLEIRTEAACEDNRGAAACVTIYDLSATRMTIETRIMYDGERESFRRNFFEFSRPAPTP